MVAAGSRASTRVVGTRAIKTSAGTTGSTRVGTPLTGISTSTSASAGTRASTGSRVGVGATGTGTTCASRRVSGVRTRAACALGTGRVAAGGRARVPSRVPRRIDADDRKGLAGERTLRRPQRGIGDQPIPPLTVAIIRTTKVLWIKVEQTHHTLSVNSKTYMNSFIPSPLEATRRGD
nr:hypothetical protein [Microbispora rosea]